jgi:hypothetical protein
VILSNHNIMCQDCNQMYYITYTNQGHNLQEAVHTTKIERIKTIFYHLLTPQVEPGVQ